LTIFGAAISFLAAAVSAVWFAGGLGGVLAAPVPVPMPLPVVVAGGLGLLAAVAGASLRRGLLLGPGLAASLLAASGWWSRWVRGWAWSVAEHHSAGPQGAWLIGHDAWQSVLLPLQFGPLLLLCLGALAFYALRSQLPRSGPTGRPARALPVRSSPLDVCVAYRGRTPVTIHHEDRYLHTMVVGTTGTGKTTRVLKPMIWQDLQAMRDGRRTGITVIEPKGDLAEDVAAMARSLGLPVVYINPEDPATPRFNPLEGPPDTVAEIMRTVLRALFGRQEAFFRQVQEIACRNTTLLLKQVLGDEVTLAHMIRALRDLSYLEHDLLPVAKRRYGQTALVEYFEREVLGELRDKMYQFALGLRQQLEDIAGNALLSRVLLGRSDVDLDRHLADGGVLVINTAMGRLGKLGDVFGQFVMMHFQNAVFRRPGTQTSRPAHALYIDEFPRYLNPDIERLLALGRSYRCAVVLAVQTTAQLLPDDSRAFRQSVLECCRNKIALTLGSAEDAELFAREFAEHQVRRAEPTYSYERGFPGGMWVRDRVQTSERLEERFPYTTLMELPQFQAVVRVVRAGFPQPPEICDLRLCEWDLRRRAPRRLRPLPGRLEVVGPGSSSGAPDLDVQFPPPPSVPAPMDGSDWALVPPPAASPPAGRRSGGRRSRS